MIRGISTATPPLPRDGIDIIKVNAKKLRKYNS